MRIQDRLKQNKPRPKQVKTRTLAKTARVRHPKRRFVPERRAWICARFCWPDQIKIKTKRVKTSQKPHPCKNGKSAAPEKAFCCRNIAQNYRYATCLRECATLPSSVRS